MVRLQHGMRSQRSPAHQGPQSVPAVMDTLGSPLAHSDAVLTGSLCCAPAIICCLPSSACSSPEQLMWGDAAVLHSVCMCMCVHVQGSAGCLSLAPAVQEVLLPDPEQEPGGGRLAPSSHQACSHPANTLVFLKRHRTA